MTVAAILAGNGEGLLSSFWRHRGLILTLTRREIVGRYRGSMLGVFWSFLSPLLMLSVYTLVFTEIFRMRWTAGGTNKLEFAIVLFAGLLVFSVFSECATRAPGLIVSNPNYVKRVVFPLQIFTWITVLTALFHFVVGLIVLLGAMLVVLGSIPPTALLLPLVILPFLLFCVGITWVLSSIGVYLRDIGQVIALVVTAMMFVSPLFFPIAAVPAPYRWLFELNPLTFPIEEVRKVLVWGALPDWTQLAVYYVTSLTVAVGGLWWFNRTRRGFADVV